jgi:predicted MPP superfamily phosphohydrolase
MGNLSRWIGFLAVFLSVYGSLHLYVLIKVRRALYLEYWSYYLFLAFLAFMMLAPILARVLTAFDFPTFALIMTWIGYVWMGYIFIFVCVAAPIDLYHLFVAGLQQLVNADLINYVLLRRHSLSLVALTAAGLMIYGAYSAYRVHPEHLAFQTPKIPAETGRVRIVQITDLHLGTMLYPGRLAPVLSAIQEAQPDILVSTGDLVDSPLRNAPELAKLIKSIVTPLGKFAVTGNHESYHGLDEALAFTEAAGFQILRNDSIMIKNLLAVAGVDDPAVASEANPNEAALLSALPTDLFRLLLKHRPESGRASEGLFDLQLSGHTHRGQIFPFGYVIRLFYPMIDGLYKISPTSHVYTSRGTGTWGPPIRLFAPPEITVIDLLPVTP